MRSKGLRLFILLVTFISVIFVSRVFAWNYPDNIVVSKCHPPMIWQKSGVMEQKGLYSLIQYKLYSYDKVYKEKFIYVAVWPVSETNRFGVKLFKTNIVPDELPQNCSEPVYENSVKMQIYLKLSKTNSLD